MGEIRKYHLKLGESARVKKGFLFVPEHSIVYAGMPAEGVFSLAVTFTIVYNSLAYNLYIPLSTKQLTAAGGRIEVIEVTPEMILFNYIG